MSDYAPPIVATLLLWWGSTGVLLYLDGLSRRTFVWSMAGATALFALALWGVVATRSETTASSAYYAFACGLTAWAWQLVSYYMGFITGPRKTRLSAAFARLAALRRGGAHEPLSRDRDHPVRSRARRADSQSAQSDWRVDLPHPVVDAYERQAQSLFRRAKPKRRAAAGAFALSGDLHDAQADEPVFPALGQRLDHRHRADRAKGARRDDAVRACRLYNSRDAHGARRRRALVSRRAATRQCALVMGRQRNLSGRSE